MLCRRAPQLVGSCWTHGDRSLKEYKYTNAYIQIQVTETLITVTPAELLPSAGKQQVLLQMLQSLLNKVSCESAVPGLDTLVSSTVLLLLTSLRSTYSSMPEKREVMGETYVGILDAAAAGEPNTSQTYSASLQV